MAGLFLALYLIWGFTYVALKIGLRYTGPWTMAGLRGLVAAVVLIGVASLLGRTPPRAVRVHRLIAGVGLLNMTGLAGLMALGLTGAGAGEAALIIYSQPLQVALLSWLLLRERLRRLQVIGLLIGFGGMAIVLVPRLDNGRAPAAWAYGVLLLAAASWALSAVLYRHWQRTDSPLAGLDILWMTGLQAGYGALPLLILGLGLEGFRLTPSFDLLWTLLFTGLGAAGIANVIWFTLLRRQGAALAAAPVFLVPVFAVIFGILVLGEALPPTLMIGGVITLCGIGMVTGNPLIRPLRS